MKDWEIIANLIIGVAFVAGAIFVGLMTIPLFDYLEETWRKKKK